MAGAKEGVENDDGVTPLRTAIRYLNKKAPTVEESLSQEREDTAGEHSDTDGGADGVQKWR